VNGVFGFRGEVRLLLFDPDSRTLFTERRVTLISPDGAERRDVSLLARKGAGKRILGRISGVDDEAAARALIGWHVVIDRALLPKPAAGEYYLHDLLDLPVFDEDGVELGTLADVVSGEKDIWVVETPDGDEAWIVATPETVRSVDVAARRITVARGAISSGE
jgi:16S rRNA processing protein RimM